MEFLMVVLVVVILVVMIRLKATLYSKLDRIDRQLFDLHLKLKEQKSTSIPAAEPVISSPVAPAPAAPPQGEPLHVTPTPVIVVEPPVIRPEEKPIVPVKDYWAPGFEVIGEALIPEAGSTTANIPEPEIVTNVYQPPPQPKPGFFERNPDLEKFIGENLVSKIGIGILVLAIGYFVKFAIDNDWIGPVGRVGIGVLCGGILVSVAHYLRKNYPAFSSVLVGGGLAVLYFTITLGYHQFHLFSQPIAFAIMLVITAFAVVLALLYDRQELAIIALVGGFAAPFMVSSSTGNFKSLFTYLVILNTGLLVLAYFKSWRLLNLLAFIFTVVLFGGWLYSVPDDALPGLFRSGLLFASIFYGLFFAINIAHNIKENKKFIASDFGILLANTALYSSVGIYFLYKMHAEQFQGLFCIIMAITNLGASYLFFRNKKIDTNILYLLIGITLTFISLTAPIQLHGNFITLFWASEAVLLYWLYGKAKLPIIRWSSFLVLGAALLSLLMDWSAIYADGFRTALPIVFNKGCLTGIYTGLAFFFFYFLVLKKEPKVFVFIIQLIAWLIIFSAGMLEVNYQFTINFPELPVSGLYTCLFIVVFVLLYRFINQRLQIFGNSPMVYLILQVLVIFVYVVGIVQVFSLQSGMLVQGLYQKHFLAHWLATALTGLIIYQAIQAARSQEIPLPIPSAILVWASCTIVVIFLSAEFHLLFNQLFFANPDNLPTIQRVYIKTGLPILWGLCSFGFMWLGMKHKNKTLRIISLTLFSVTLLKLFAYDIRNIPVAGKIAAFFCLGVLLLVVSFMYQRLKKIIIDDEQKSAE